MDNRSSHIIVRGMRLMFAVTVAALLVGFALAFAIHSSAAVHAAPIEPPAGYPKLSLSTKLVSPNLAHVGGATLSYVIEIVNTGAYAASDVVLTDVIPAHTTYNGDATSSAPPAPTYANGMLTWTGEVGFDASVRVSFSVDVDPAIAGVISNTAVINQPQIPRPVTVTAETLVTDDPVFKIEKTSAPDKPGANKPLTYDLVVTNIGQPTVNNLPLTVNDAVPDDTSVIDPGPDGSLSQGGRLVTWQRNVSLGTGETSVFTFTVGVGDVPSGTVLTNQDYQVSSSASGTTAGEIYTTTVIDPIFLISKSTFPDPPGSNREMTYTLTVLNVGSLATDLVVTDEVPAGVTYVDGGAHSNGQVTWTLPRLDTGESAQFSFKVEVGDVAEVVILNSSYGVCSAEGVCQNGHPLSSLIKGPTFDASLWLDPIAKKPGGGNDAGPVTPTLVLRNLGPGSALGATASIVFQRINVSFSDLLQNPPLGQFYPGPVCGDKCYPFLWVGDLAAGQAVTITTEEGQNSVGGEPGTHYTATVVITDQLGSYVTQPFTGTVTGTVIHHANLIPIKTAPPVVAAGMVMTYNIEVLNSGLSTDVPPYPVLTETIPLSTSLVSVSDGGVANDMNGRTVISWTLPAMSTGDMLNRTFSVLVNGDLISGTQIVNRDYRTLWISGTTVLSNTGTLVTSTVREIGLIDSFKTVSPVLVKPGPGHVLTYTLHVVNSSPSSLSGVHLYDIFPWEHSTYRRNAVATAGQIISDIVSLEWFGNVAPFDTELITFSVLVDADYQGAITNTATIDHPSLREPVPIIAVAYVTQKPVLSISKTDSPDPVRAGGELLYTLRVQNLGQQATNVEVTDLIPAHTTYLSNSATAGGELEGDVLRWWFPLLAPGEVRTFSFLVQVLGGQQLVNDTYGVTCAEGISAIGIPVYTDLAYSRFYLPFIRR